MILATLSLAASLVARVTAVQSAVPSYTATAHAAVTFRTFPYLSASPEGTLYHKEPGRNKLVFTSGVPVIAQPFSNVFPNFPSASQWEAQYAIRVQSRGGGFTTLELVPRSPGRVTRIDARIDERTADVESLRFVYSDGGFAAVDQTYTIVQGHRLVGAERVHFEDMATIADATLSFANFDLNASIPDSIFQ